MTSGKRLAVALGIGMIALLGSVSAAQAQYAPPPPYYPPPPPPRGMYRGGLVVGFGLGGGGISASNCPACGAAGGLEFHIGAMVNPRLAVMFDGWGLGRPTDNGNTTLTNSMGGGGVQFWVTDQFWVKGLLGFGTIRLADDYGNSASESALAIGGAGGFEVMQSGNFALDLQLRLAHMAYDGGGANNVAFMVGFNWY